MSAISAGRLVDAQDAEIAYIAALMNRAYRGHGGQRGWSNETTYIDGDRTTEAFLRQDLAVSPRARLLVWRRAPGPLAGCVWLDPLGEDIWYLGSLASDSGAQNGGLGRDLLAAAEDWVRAQGGRGIRMTVVNVRDSLIAWYVRRGYTLTGETEPFPYDEARFGVPKRPDLCFVILVKDLTPAA